MISEAPFQAPVIELDSKAVTEDSDGTLWIEGTAADFGLDRDDEAFLPGSLDRGIKQFMEHSRLLAYHHGAFGTASVSADGIKSPNLLALGEVTELEPRGSELHMKARIDKPAPGSWSEDIYNKVKSGTIRMLSVGGRFKRAETPDGPRIYDADIAEITVTPMAINPRTSFRVVQGKAFVAAEENPELAVATAMLDRLEAVIATAGRTLEGKAATRVHAASEPNNADHAYIGQALQVHRDGMFAAKSAVENGSNPALRALARRHQDFHAQQIIELHKLAAKIGPGSTQLY